MKKISLNLIILFLFLNTYNSYAQSECVTPEKPTIIPSYINHGFKKPSKPRSINTILIMSAKEDDKKVTTHLLIAKDGSIRKLVLEKNIAIFSKKERMPDGRANIENFAIGITLVQKDGDTVTDGQYSSLVSLVADLSSRYKIKNIVSLRGLTPDFDIGPYNFDWNKFKTDYDTKCGSEFVNKETMFTCPVSATKKDDQNLRSLTVNPLKKSYIAPNLVPIKPEYSEGRMFCIKGDTYDAYKTMREDAMLAGVKINVNSAFRDALKQKELFLESKKKGELNHVATVGESEHQLGTAFDFYSGTVPKKFVTTPEYTWLTQNAWKYGFVETYKQIVDGISIKQNEPWHWRYVGTDEAKKIFDSSAPLITHLEARLPSGRN